MDEVGDFLEEQRAKVAMDRMCLENLPYMEIKTKADSKDIVPPTDSTSTRGNASKPSREESAVLSLQLGAEYDLKKQRLQQELRMDYRRYVSQKKDLNAGGSGPQPQGLSLPIGERRSAKNKLRDERHQEYKDFLKRQAGHGQITSNYPVSSQVQAPETERIAAPDAPSPVPEGRRRPLPSRRDAVTQSETGGAGRGTGTWGPALPRGRGRHWGSHGAEEEAPEPWERRPRRQRGRREERGSEEELSSDWEEEEEEEWLEFLDRRRPRRSREPEYIGRRERRVYHRPDRAVRERRETESPAAREENNRHQARKSLSATPKPKLQMPAATNATARCSSASNKDKAEFATGLMIGTAEGDGATQRRKDRYRQDLLEQMAEQQRNRKKEKDLELRVAATGAIDPEKEPDRIKQFGAVNRDYGGRRREVPYRPGLGLDALGTQRSSRPLEEKPSVGAEERGPPGRPRVAFPCAPQDYSTALGQLAGAGVGMGGPGAVPLHEDFHRSLSSTLGEIVAPRIAGVPPPMPPTLTDAYRTPYDDAYYYYGARNPLDPSLPYYGAPGGGGEPTVLPNPHPGASLPPGLAGRPGGASQRGMPVGVLPGDRPKQTKESVLSYQEALRQQIQERKDRSRQEREERDRYDAKLEAEMKAYEPWGRAGGGAPLRDHTGNLISDLNRMHRTNEEAYVNPPSRDRAGPQGAMGRNRPAPQVEDRVPSAHRISGFAQPSPFARGNVFADPPTPQQLREQDTYKDSLRRQIEEKRRREAEERERTRMEEEREERKLAEQRARIQQEYEEEQEKKKRKEFEQGAKNEELIRQAEDRRRTAERKMREEDEREDERERETLRLQHERERHAQPSQREPSPPIPALQKRLAKQQHTPRPPSAVSLFSSRTLSERSMSVPQSPPVPARRNQLRATEEQQGVISELSALRRQLRSEQRRLEGQLGPTDREEADTPLQSRRRGRPPVDVFDMARMRAQVSNRRPASGTAAAQVNMHNIREFNRLKYRDSASREEVRHVYPDPPSDGQSLDIQQQALLREQQRSVRTMRTMGEEDSASREEVRHVYPDPPSDGQSLDIQQQALLREQQRSIRTMRTMGEEERFELSPQERQSHRHPGEEPARSYGRHKVSLLDSESAFIDYPRGEASPVPLRSRQRQPSSAQPGRRDRRRDSQEEMETPGPGVRRAYEGRSDTQSLVSVTSLDLEDVRDRSQRRMRRLDPLHDHDRRTGGLTAGGEGDDFSLRSAPYGAPPDGRVSVETVATEPWLRPGTSDTVKRAAAGGQSRRDRHASISDLLEREWDGPSTYHG